MRVYNAYVTLNYTYLIYCTCQDVAAGALIIEEAGGRVTDVYGSPFTLTTRNFVSSNGHIHEELLGRLVEARMWVIEGEK